MPKYDMYLQGKSEEGTNGFHTFTFAYDRTIAVRGPYKLAIQWLKRFLTTRGSDPCAPDDGTEFSALVGGNLTSFKDIRDVVLLAIQDCNDQMRTLQQQQTPPPDPDEQLQSATLTSFQAVGSDGFECWVTLRNAANAEITVPLPQIP